MYWKPTDTSEFLNPNLAVVGTMGTGKTQTVKSIVTQLVRQRHLNTNDETFGMLIFDYKSDYCDSEFVNATGALVLEANNMPINPFALHGDNRLAPVKKAVEIADTLTAIFNLGVKQKGALKKLIVAAYERRNIFKNDVESFKNTPPTMAEVIKAFFSQDKVTEDSLASALSDLDDFELFEANPRKCKSLYGLLDNQVVVVKLSGLSTSIQTLIVELMLDQFHLQMHQSPKPEANGSHRAFKKAILVDEADNFMSQDFPTLKKIMQEGREFGVGTILSTQGLDHFQTGKENYAKNITSWICHRLNNPSVTDVKPLLNLEEKSDLDNELRRLRELPKHYSLFLDGQKQVHYQESTAFYRLSK
ncbi:cell division protein ftsK [Vibrio sp. JCM 19236]|nr:cell division protein ftsK [Vibrio sp. JCM 19236]